MTLYDRISKILGRDCPASGGVSGEAIGVIREPEERLEAAYQEIEIIDDLDLPEIYQMSLEKAMNLTDSVQDYPARESV